MKKTMCKTALTLVAAIVMTLLAAVCIAVPAYASVDPAQYVTPKQTTMFIAGLFLNLALGIPFIVLFVGAALEMEDLTRGAAVFFVGSIVATGMLLGTKGWLW